MFSPYYFWSGRGAPENHVAINVALYGRGARWAMTERGAGALRRGRAHLSVGASAMIWDGASLRITINERCAPWPARVLGEVVVRPLLGCSEVFALDAAGRHLWRPIAPLAAIDARFSAPALQWSGLGYFDANWGAEPIETGFRRWTWSRTHDEAAAEVCYDAEARDGAPAALALRFTPQGVETAARAPMRALGRGFWGVTREARIAQAPRAVEVWEDAPFYTRTRLLAGETARETICETLDCDRLAHSIVRRMLPVRMPRRA